MKLILDKITQQQRIRETQEKLKAVSTKEELLALIRPLCSRGVFLFHVFTCLYLILVGVITCILISFIYNIMGGIAIIFLMIGYIVGAIVYAFRIYLLEQLGETIVLKYLSLKYGFSIDTQLPEELKASKDLNRGNYTRDIKRQIQGTYKGERHDIDYYFCHLHYVDEYSSSDSKEYKHYDRYYVFVPFPWLKGVVLRSDSLREIDYPFDYETTLREFNNVYKLTGLTEMNCARFAKPVTIFHLLKFNKILEAPNFIFSENGWLCIGFNNCEPFYCGERATIISNPKTFYQMIEAGIKMPQMKPFFEMVHQLVEQHDDNFSEILK